MSRNAVTIGFSVPPETAELVERLAAAEGRSKSALFRDMVRLYREQREIEVFEELAEYGRRKAAKAGIRTVADVERLIDEARGGG
ncbi:MAG: CopG family transcriptional regulator [Coriobacteriales bacterium]|nr:CopG family transcriptional regulator [Coriobacteriales bacterium]